MTYLYFLIPITVHIDRYCSSIHDMKKTKLWIWKGKSGIMDQFISICHINITILHLQLEMEYFIGKLLW